MLKAYEWKPCEDEDTCVIVIAADIKEAKQIGLDFWATEYGFDNDYIEIRVKWQKKANITGLEKGVVDWREGLKRELYGYVEMECEECQEIGMLTYDEKKDKALCDGCMYPEEEEKK